MLKTSKVSCLAGADKSALSFSSVVSLDILLNNNVRRAVFVNADCLAVDDLVGMRYLKEHLNSIDFKHQRLLSQAAPRFLFYHQRQRKKKRRKSSQEFQNLIRRGSRDKTLQQMATTLALST